MLTISFLVPRLIILLCVLETALPTKNESTVHYLKPGTHKLTNLMALYSTALVMKDFNSNRKLF